MTSSDIAEYVAGWAVVGFFVWLFGYALYQDKYYGDVCVEKQTISKVEGFVESRHNPIRTVFLSEGGGMYSSKGLHKSGDEVCVRTEHMKLEVDK